MLAAVFPVGIVAGFFGSMVGGGSLLSIPFLIFLGLPPQVAIATDRFGGMGAATSALIKFWKAKKVVWKYVLPLSVVSLVGSLIGANILLNLDTEALQNIAGVLLLMLLPFVFLKRNIGIQRNKTGLLLMGIGLVLYFLIQIFTGFFGAGTGVFIFYILMLCFGLTITEAVATQSIPLLVLSISSLALFALHGIIDYEIGIVLLAGMALGGYIGAHFALKKGNKWIKGLFAVIVIISGIKLLFF